MSRSVGITVENNFTKGFLTEFSGLNFPENSCLDVLNCVFTENGEAYRRKPVDREYGFVMNSVVFDPDTDAVVSHVWSGVGLLGNTSFVVFQIGQTLHFWQANASGASISSSKKSFTVNLETYKTAGAPSTATEKCSFASGNGRLFVAHSYCQPFYITYEQDTDSVSIATPEIKVRDFGVQDDGLAIDNEPTTLSNAHKYNIMNQGWTNTQITSWFSSNAKYPSKAQIPWYFRNATNNEYDFRPSNRSKYPSVGGSLSPRGYFILDAFNQDRSAVSGVSGIPIVSSGYQRPTTVAFMNSRVFYAGTKSSKFSSTIYFSSILKAASDDIQFYQRNDPTSEVANELLSNDGGTIVIPEAESIVALFATKTYLIVFCTNGLWAIGGSEGVGFSATDYMVQRISEVPVYSPQSVIIVDNTPVWWNYDGIYATSVGLENLQVSSLTKDSIQAFYERIPNNCKLQAHPTYNRLASEIQWLYSSDEDHPNIYDSMLVMKTTTKAFYKHDFNKDYCNIVGSVAVTQENTGYSSDNVVTDTLDPVIITSLDNVVISKSSGGDFTSLYTMLLVKEGNNVTFCSFYDGDHIDWITMGNSTPFDSYLTPAYRVRGDAIRKFQVNFIEVYTKALTNDSCFLRGVWDYATHEAANGYTVYQQVIPVRTHRAVLSRKLRLRGSGKTLNLEFRSDGAKPFHLVGWVTQDIVNDGV